MKKLLKLTIVLIVSLITIGCGKTSSTLPALDYNDFPGQFIEITDDQLYMPESDYYIYFYSLNCYACQLIKNDVLNTFYDASETTVYLVDISVGGINPNTGVTGTPTIIRVVDNVVVESYPGRTAILEMLDDIN